MSVDYFFSCEDCKCRLEEFAITSRLSGDYLEHKEQVLKFLLKHRDHNLKLFSEFDEDRFDYKKDLIFK